MAEQEKLSDSYDKIGVGPVPNDGGNVPPGGAPIPPGGGNTPDNGENVVTDPIKKMKLKYWAIALVVLLLAGGVAEYLRSSHHIAPVDIEETGPMPALDGNSWRVKQMNGLDVAVGTAGAEVRSTNSDSTSYRMIVLTDMENPVTVNMEYNRTTGRLESPELGDGYVERKKNPNKLIMIFEGWKLEKSAR